MSENVPVSLADSGRGVRCPVASVHVRLGRGEGGDLGDFPNCLLATFCLVQQMFQSCSHTQVWRKKRKMMMKMNMMMAPVLKNRQIRTGFSQAHAHQTPMPRTTAASCFLYWWPLVSSFLLSSASADCESKPHRASAKGLGGKELDQTRLLSISPYCS